MIPMNEFINSLSLVVFHAVTSRTDVPHLQNIFLRFKAPDQLQMIGTDGNRMATVNLWVNHGQPDGTGFVLYLEYAKKLLKVFKPDHTQMTICPLGSEIVFTNSALAEVFPAPETTPEIPNFDKIINAGASGAPSGVFLNADYLLDSVTAAKPFMDKDNPTVKLTITGAVAPVYLDPKLRADLVAVRSVQIIIMCKWGGLRCSD